MKKKVSLLLALTMAAVMILSAVPALADKTVINYWSNDRHDEVYMTEMIEKFNAAHDDIEINMTIMTDDYENSILLAIDGGNAPDIIGQSVTLKNMTSAGSRWKCSDGLRGWPGATYNIRCTPRAAAGSPTRWRW